MPNGQLLAQWLMIRSVLLLAMCGMAWGQGRPQFRDWQQPPPEPVKTKLACGDLKRFPADFDGIVPGAPVLNQAPHTCVPD